MPLLVPLSYRKLPTLKMPEDRHFERAEALKGALIEEAGFQPGTYTTFDEGVYPRAAAVHEGMMRALVAELSELEAAGLCVRLYKWHEELIGNINRARYHSAPDLVLGGHHDIATKYHQVWEKISPLTEALRWLVEIAVKYCPPSGGMAGRVRLSHLLALAVEISVWDGVWENLAHRVVPHELVIESDFTTRSGPTTRAIAAKEAYLKAAKPRMVESYSEWVDTVRPGQKWVELNDLFELPEFKLLEEPVEEELGYRLSDWVLYSAGLVDSFTEVEQLKVIRGDKLRSFLQNHWGFSGERLTHVLADHAISIDLMATLPPAQLMPVEHARRDSRLLRRPVVVLAHRGSDLYIYGIETLNTGLRMFMDRLQSGRLRFPRMSDAGPIRRAIGKIQTNLGDRFRDSIAERCQDRWEYRKEMGRIESENIPSGQEFGPVDVLIVDRFNRRFVLVEAKDVADEGLVPKLMRSERTEFLEYVRKMNLQVAWFNNRVTGLKREFMIAPEDDYTVEGVIVVSSPRLWLYTEQIPLPVVDDREFFKMLRQGARLETAPVPL